MSTNKPLLDPLGSGGIWKVRQHQRVRLDECNHQYSAGSVDAGSTVVRSLSVTTIVAKQNQCGNDVYGRHIVSSPATFNFVKTNLMVVQCHSRFRTSIAIPHQLRRFIQPDLGSSRCHPLVEHRNQRRNHLCVPTSTPNDTRPNVPLNTRRLTD
jgi:hypothetical protein